MEITQFVVLLFIIIVFLVLIFYIIRKDKKKTR